MACIITALLEIAKHNCALPVHFCHLLKVYDHIFNISLHAFIKRYLQVSCHISIERSFKDRNDMKFFLGIKFDIHIRSENTKVKAFCFALIKTVKILNKKARKRCKQEKFASFLTN